MPRPQAVRRRTTVTRAPRSRARLISATNRRDSWRSHVHRTRFRRPRSSSSADLPMCGVEGQDPSSFLSGVQGGYSLSRKRVSPFSVQRHWRCFPGSAHRADKPVPLWAQKKSHPFGWLSLYPENHSLGEWFKRGCCR